jgi:acyl phosphate:glycerol-3-phosphate acyltransferase
MLPTIVGGLVAASPREFLAFVAPFVATVVAGYLIGSIPVAHLVGRYAGDHDLRFEGEGNVGARNTFHVVGAGWGVVVFVGDFLKGAVVAHVFVDAPTWQLVTAGTAALVGHGYPVWLGFVGGKGLSTAGGFAALLMPWAAAIGGVGAGCAWFATRKFLPSTVVAIVVAIIAAPFVGVSTVTVTVVVWMFVVTGLKRAVDESRMREIEASTGWDRNRGLRP